MDWCYWLELETTGQISNNLIQKDLGGPSSKVAQIILIGWKLWLPGGVVSFPYVNIGKLIREATLANMIVLLVESYLPWFWVNFLEDFSV